VGKGLGNLTPKIKETGGKPVSRACGVCVKARKAKPSNQKKAKK